jgi:hypothetical protein
VKSRAERREISSPRASAEVIGRISQSNAETLSRRDAPMTKMFSFALAFVLFAPVAISVAMQAARIVT